MKGSKSIYDYQQDIYSCGAHSLRNAVASLGIYISLEKAKELCRTGSVFGSAAYNLTPSKLMRNPVRSFRKFLYDIGTDEKGIIRALKKLKLRYKEFESDDEDKFISFLRRSIKSGSSAILFFNYTQDKGDTGHWVACTGYRKDRYIIIDSAPYSGKVLKEYSADKLLERFTWTDDEEKYYYNFYLITISKPD